MKGKALPAVVVILAWSVVGGLAIPPAASEEVGQPDKPTSAYHFIAAFSRDALVAREVLVLRGQSEGLAGQQECERAAAGDQGDRECQDPEHQECQNPEHQNQEGERCELEGDAGRVPQSVQPLPGPSARRRLTEAGRGGQRAAAGALGPMRFALPAWARVVEATDGVTLADEDAPQEAGSELVLEFGPRQTLSWTFHLPLSGDTQQIVRRLPLPVEFASVMLEAVGPNLEVLWPREAAGEETAYLPARTGSQSQDFVTSTARQVPADSPITIRISGIPDLTPESTPRWPLWAMLGLGVLAAVATLQNFLKKAEQEPAEPEP